MTLLDFIARLRELDIQLWIDGENLRFSSPKGGMPPGVLDEIRQRKPELLAFLRGAQREVRATSYITTRDGTRLAVDLYRPSRAGVPIEAPLPVIWTHDRYQRAYVTEGVLLTRLDVDPWLRTILQHHYVIAVVDVRGGGASHGTRETEFSREETLDSYDVTEWFAAQPWCSGKVGMFGRSYLGITQYLAASTAPPHLSALFPEMAFFDLYDFLRGGGIFRHDFVRRWGSRVRKLDTNLAVATVGDGAFDSQSLIEEHLDNGDVLQQAAALPFRDSRDPRTGALPYVVQSPSSYLQQIQDSRIPLYHLAGWYDTWSRDSFIWFNNLNNPQKLVIGPWHHTTTLGFDTAAAHLRWYDHWLKGIDNGVMDEPPILYYTIGAEPGQEWRTAWRWPLPEAQPVPYYLHGGRSGSVGSVNDGLLLPASPLDNDGDRYVVDYGTTSGSASRWVNASSEGGKLAPFGYPDMTANDERGLTYTTPVLEHDLEITGHPIAHLWVSSTARDGHFFAYLEDIDEQGRSSYITEGALAASHRGLHEAPYNSFGLPYHRCCAADLLELPDEPVELVFDLFPISYRLRAGHRLRLAITCADHDNALTPELSPPPTVTIHRSPEHASYVLLPIVQPGAMQQHQASAS